MIERLSLEMPRTSSAETSDFSWAPQKARKSDLVRHVTDALRKEIIEGRFDETTFLPSEVKIAEMFGVSRPVVRESMRMLRSQGLVETRQGRRPQVKPMDHLVSIDALSVMIQRGAGSLEDLLEVRYSIECDIAHLAAQRAGPEEIEALAKTVEDLKVAKETKSIMEADHDFHLCLAKCSKNAIYEVLIRLLHGLLDESLRHTVTQKGKDCALPGHKAILKAIRAADPEGAWKAMHNHLDGTQKLLKKRNLRRGSLPFKN